jgi:hypothetical protein
MTVTFTGSVFHLNLASSLLGLLFNPEDGGGTFIPNVGGFYQTIQHYSPKGSTLHTTEDSTHKDLFHMYPAGQSRVIPGKPACQVTCNYSLKTTVWSAGLLKVK